MFFPFLEEQFLIFEKMKASVSAEGEVSLPGFIPRLWDEVLSLDWRYLGQGYSLAGGYPGESKSPSLCLRAWASASFILLFPSRASEAGSNRAGPLGP